MDVSARANRLRAALTEHDVDGLVVTSLTNIRWLTGFTGSNATAWIDDDSLVLYTDGRYQAQAPRELQANHLEATTVIASDPLTALGEALNRARVGVEADQLTWADQQRFAASCSAELVPTSGLILGLRAIKDAGELDRIRTAAAIADEALAQTALLLEQTPSERQVALQLDHTMQALGATASAYETIVAAGPNAALPHARPTDRPIVPGDLVVIDVGALVDGYRSDMTRTFIVGEPTELQGRQLEVVQQAQAAGAASVRHGVATSAVDEACRAVIGEAGWAEAFSHGTGHGVGLDIHEMPRVNRISADVLAAGMVVTVEPGVYFEGQGGVRWEDLLIVTADGAECLSGSPKAPLVSAWR
jgi:Xaa-Pro aminopeptidase